MQPVRVVVAGATGKVGREMVRAVVRDQGFTLTGAVAADGVGRDIGELIGLEGGKAGVLVYGTLEDALKAGMQADVLIDFSVAAAARKTIPAAVAAGIAPVVGTTGFEPGEVDRFSEACRARELGGAFIANYAVGVMLMMRFAEEARRFMPHVEIIEQHHHTKLDAPSGTALRTKARLERALGDLAAPPVQVHSVRLPGLVAHQEVIFGGPGQTLTIRHDAPTREAYVPGVLMTCKWVLKEKRVALDLEEVAFPR
ncbi:MAG TPA: 4-hydroxy-tetrahydrodipicolinate reductase [Symbiobacteriaceae bacterium]|jgi:4-hydroxy-tetrahydrodipicolinate reductase|nr:4-hydroxy-tetrahydrodipicolinate reductase [Symbiobacteriaceae bacterium]